MESITNAVSRALNYMSTIGMSDFLDILIVAYLIYKAIWFVRKTNSYNIARGIFFIVLSLWISEIFNLTMINYILRKTVELGAIALLVLFQSELRRLLERVGSGFAGNHSPSGTMMRNVISQLVMACDDMSASRTGALIVIERSVALSSVISTGTVINADVAAELLKNIFYNKAPLHDGAVIIRGGRIEAAGCVLPLTQRLNLSKDLGMRHRAALGMSEQSDAIILVVSEETGAISEAMDGGIKRHLSPESLEALLCAQLLPDENTKELLGISTFVKRFFKGNENVSENENEKTL